MSSHPLLRAFSVGSTHTHTRARRMCLKLKNMHATALGAREHRDDSHVFRRFILLSTMLHSTLMNTRTPSPKPIENSSAFCICHVGGFETESESEFGKYLFAAIVWCYSETPSRTHDQHSHDNISAKNWLFGAKSEYIEYFDFSF